MTSVPIYRPTIEQFQNFHTFMNFIETQNDVLYAGCVKIISPPERRDKTT